MSGPEIAPAAPGPRAANDRPTVTAEDLHRACDALIQTTRVKVDQGRGEEAEQWQQLPSLLEQLGGADAAYRGPGGVAGARSKAPINTGVVALLEEISAVSRRQLQDVGYTGTPRPELPRTVRAATTATISTGDGVEMAAWLWVLARWFRAIRRELKLDAGRRQWLRGLACPHCKATVAGGVDGDGHGVQTPALAVTWAPPDAGLEHVDDLWRWDGVDCRACGRAWIRGVTMHLLIEALRVPVDDPDVDLVELDEVQA